MIVVIAIIFMLGLSSFTMWTRWEIKQFLVATYEQQNISDDYTRLLLVLHRLGMVSVVAIATTTILATLFIRKSLLPLRQVNHWAAELGSYQPNLQQTPNEVKALANRRTREVFRGKRAIELTAKEFDLLEYLLGHPRQVFTRDQILEKV